MDARRILSTLQDNGIKTVGDLDRWRAQRSHNMTRHAALVELVGPAAADQIVDTIADRMIGDYWRGQYARTAAAVGGAL